MSGEQGERPRKRKRGDGTDAQPTNTQMDTPTGSQGVDGIEVNVEASDSDGVGDGVERNGIAPDAAAQGLEERKLDGTDSVPENPPHSQPPPRVYSPRSSVWLEDGNCFVIAEHTVALVYRGLLERHSQTLKSMLSNRCYYVMLGSDTPILTLSGQLQHVEVMLLWTLGERQLNTLSLGDLAACHELGAYYKIEDLRVATLDLLSARYPHKLSTWLQAQAFPPDIGVTEHLLVASITAARGEAQIASLALYEALESAGFSSILNKLGDLSRSPHVKPERIDRLRQAVITAYPHLISSEGRTYSKLLQADTCVDCTATTSSSCLEAMQAAVHTFLRNADQIHGFAAYEYAACAECRTYYDRILRKRMKFVCKSLPSYFGLVTDAGEGIPESTIGPAAAFLKAGEQPTFVVDLPEPETDMEALLQRHPHVRPLLEHAQAQENAARELVAAALAHTDEPHNTSDLP